jgi:hypothetical protein
LISSATRVLNSVQHCEHGEHQATDESDQEKDFENCHELGDCLRS